MDYHRARMSDSTKTSSFYSGHAEQRPQYPLGVPSPGSRPVSRTSYTPSYMSIPRNPMPTGLEHNGGITSGVQTRSTSSASTAVDIATNDRPSSGPPGVLLVLVAGALHPSILQYLETLLARQALAGIVLAARQEQELALKQLKMDTYALIGKLRREMSVDTYLKESWSQAEMNTLLQDATRPGTSIQGVICCPEYAEVGDDCDVFELEEDVLEKSWKRSVTFLHAASRAIIPQLLSKAKNANGATNGKPIKEPRGPFFIVASSRTHTSVSQIAKAASDALVQQLVAATKPKGLTVGYAESLLIPDPVVKDDPKPALERMVTDVTYNGHMQDSVFTPGESPTKLWNMWALQDQLDRGD